MLFIMKKNMREKKNRNNEMLRTIQSPQTQAVANDDDSKYSLIRRYNKKKISKL